MKEAIPTALEILPGMDLVGKLVGKYRITRELGRGGMGAVFEAVHEDIGQRAAVKVLHPELSRDPKMVHRFFDEARAVGMVDHPGLVKIFDVNQLAGGTVYILMEFLAGESLHQRVQRLEDAGETLQMPEALRIIRQMASTLQSVHEKGIIHRDLKPENVLLVRDPDSPTGERTKIVDFGIAKLQDGGERRTTEGKVLGTPLYMSPEVCQATGPVDAKTDVYSLGIMLYELLAGRLPFRADSWIGIVMAHLSKKPVPLREVRSAVPEEVAALVDQMLRKEPAARPTMAEVVTRIDALERGAALAVPSSGKGPLLIAAAVLLVALGAAAVALTRGRSAPPPSPPPVARPAPPPKQELPKPAPPRPEPPAAAPEPSAQEPHAPGRKKAHRARKETRVVQDVVQD